MSHLGDFWWGYRSGKWNIKHEINEPNDVDYNLADASSLVLLDGKCCALHDIVVERRASRPDKTGICYFEMEDKPKENQPAFFELKAKQNITFKASDTVVEMKTSMKQEHTGVFCAQEVWQNKFMVSIVWVVSWSVTQGLKPKRPVIIFAKPMIIPKQFAVKVV